MANFVKKRGDTQVKEKIKKVGIWSYDELYRFCYDWFKAGGYLLFENKYLEKDSDFGKEIQLSWLAVKKVNSYIKFEIKTDWHIIGMTSKELEKDGKKIKTNKGEVKISISGDMRRDYTGKWGSKSIFGSLRNLYEGYIIRTTLDEYEDDIAEETLEFIQDLKDFLELI